MFKRLRERIAEEGIKFPVSQPNTPNSGKQGSTETEKTAIGNSTEDLITLSNSPSVVVPHTSSQQFSIGEDEDGSMSEQNTPQKKHNDSFNGSTSEQFYTPTRDNSNSVSDLGYGPQYRPSKSHYIPQSDIESEREDPPTLNLESISKDQLLTIIDMLKAKSYKYKNKYSEVVKNFKELRDEKLKIETTLTEHQDKALRRIAELREQCQLEQKAKAHLEANLRLMLEEKDSRISVLETQINLLKKDQSNSFNFDPNEIQTSETSTGDLLISTSSSEVDVNAFQEKMERFEHQITQAKKTITNQTEQISLLRKQNESISLELEEKIKALNEMEDQLGNAKSQHEFILKGMQGRLEELENQKEESLMSMAETKKNMHEELEFKEKQLRKAEEEAKQLQIACDTEKSKVLEIQKLHEGKVKELQHQLESTERMLEDEKQNLMQELGRGKTAAISLMQQECAKKIAAVEEEWKVKLEKYESQKSISEEQNVQVKDLEKNVVTLKEKLMTSEEQGKELIGMIQKLNDENKNLKSSLEKSNSENLVNHHDENLKCVTDKLENAERNYATQMSEMKSRILLLEKEKLALENEKSELLKDREKLSNLEEGESAIKSELQSKDDELRKLQQKYETSNKDQSQKIQNFQESMKDKENMIVKLKASIATITKENAEKIEEFKKRIKALEEEREQLMIQAQERVSTTEAKCRDDIKALQEKNNKLLLDNKEMEKTRSKCTQLEKELLDVRVQSESQLSAVDKELSLLKEQLLRVEGQLKDSEKAKEVLEAELSGRVNKLQEENSLLLGKSNHFESLKAEKEELNEKLKQAEQQVTSVKQLENEKEDLKRDNASISQELEQIKARCLELETKLKSLEKRELQYKSEMKKLESRNQNLESEIAVLKSSLDSEIKEKEDLLQKVNSLEVSQSSNSGTSAIEEEMDQKLKNLVRDFSIQMDNKDKDCDRILAESLDKEEKLINEHRTEIASLRQTMFEKDCALDEMREHYQEILLEKETKLKDLQMSIKKLSENNGSNASNDSALLTTEGSDWDETWAVPDEECIENTSPVHITCKEHLLQIESLQEELSKCNCEIKELKVLLRLSPPESMNNNQRDSYQSLPEPTELEYLKNIIFEYMMGKEPITLAKVIAAVLRFSDTQTQQVMRREEAKHPTR